VPGPLTGITAPGNMLHLTPVAHVSYSANFNYRLKTFVDSPIVGQNLGQQISVRNLGVMGGNLQNFTMPGEEQTFNGTGEVNALYLMGSPTTYNSPTNSGRETSTATGTRGPVRWRCYVPSVPEDRYVTTVTYMLQRA